MTTYTINTNTNFNSVEITFNGKPSEAIREALKDMRFRWHNVKKVWYGYKDAQTVKQAIDAAENGTKAEATQKTKKEEKKNKYGVKVGDIFSSSWGYEQTNVDFFQVVALVGECSVRVREVRPQMIGEKGISGMSSDRTYKLTKELLPALPDSIFIEDQENGDLKRIKPGYCKEQAEANAHCFFNVNSYATAHKCNGESITCYESWYY